MASDGNRSRQQQHPQITPFPALPEELIKVVLEYACEPVGTGAPQGGGPILDVITAKAIVLVSHATYNLVTPIIYRNVSLTRPSQLTAFASTLLRRPALGLLVRNIFVGHLDSPNFLPLFVGVDASYARSARAHLQRWKAAQGDTGESDGWYFRSAAPPPAEAASTSSASSSSSSSSQAAQPVPLRRLHHQSTPDQVYLERGADYAAMHVPSLTPQLTNVRRTRPPRSRRRPARQNADTSSDGEDDDDRGEADRQANISMYGFGIDRAGWGNDASGEWIGMDPWILRSIDLQHALEFHYEWVGITSQAVQQEPEKHAGENDEVLMNDPLDWADAVQYPVPLPSEERRQREVSFASASTDEDRNSNAARFGFEHLDHFFKLRAYGYTPRGAAELLIRKQLGKQHASLTKPVPALSAVCNVDLLSGESEPNHFLSPALFARSGAIHLLLQTNPPEGADAPPDTIPAHIAAVSAHRRRRRGMRFDEQSSSDDTSSSSNDEAGNEGRGTGRPFRPEGRNTDIERHTLDLVDVFGHVETTSRMLYPPRGGSGFMNGAEDDVSSGEHNGNSIRIQPNGRAEDPEDDGMQFSQTLRQRGVETNWLHTQTPGTMHLDIIPRAEPLPTLGSLIASLRAVLSFCPRVRVLSLNGFLERAVAGTRECAGLPDLRHLSLGPPPPYWSSALNLHQRTLATVRTLHIAGCMLYRSEAMAIGGFFKSALPRLREFEWTVWIEHVVEHPINIVEALSYLLGAEGRHATTGRSGSATVSTTARTNAPPASASRSMAYVQRRKPLRRVAASINPYDVTLWQRSASPALRDDPRLVLQACEPTVESNLCAVRSWWERKAGV